MINVEQPNDKALVINGHTVAFQQRIATFIPLSDRVVVHLKTANFKYGDKLVGRNLLACGPDGKQLWRVANHGMMIGARHEDAVTQPDETGRRHVPHAIFEVIVSKKNGMFRDVLLDFALILDPENGEIVDFEYRR